uniref:NOL1/NOP2/NSUN 5/7 ferredoxin-like domain-containing protein n=1 Tax=Myripristis murdjan TaxID=586833 RepID=A0A667WGJ5_9TELE
MGRKRNGPGHSRRSPACKTNSESQISSIKDLSLPDGPSHGEIPVLHPDPSTPGQGLDEADFLDNVYLLAAAVFQNNHLEKPAAHRLVNYGKKTGLLLPEVKDEELQRKAYELAFNTLKYDQMSLVAVMLFDFQDRKFIPWKCRGESVQEIGDVKNLLLRFKIKLAAALARCRIKHNLLTIDCILPESLKTKQERSSRLPLYAWVNTLKSSLDEVQSVLRTAGVSQVKSIRELEGQTFCQDTHCGDTLVFPTQLRAELYRTGLLSDHKLIIQDKACSLGPNAVCSLLSGEGDVLMAGCFSGLTVAHTASLIAGHHEATSKDQSKVYVCVGHCTAAQREELQDAVTDMGCKSRRKVCSG